MAPAGQWPCSLDAAGSLPTRRALSIRLSDFNKYATHGPCVLGADRIHKRLIQTIVNGLADKPLVLNGGTALMRAYHRDRYSEDIPMTINPRPAPPVGGVGLTGFDFVYTRIMIDNLYIALHRPAPARGISPVAAAERRVSHTVRLAERHYS